MMHVDLLLAFAILESAAACGHRCFTSCDQTPSQALLSPLFVFFPQEDDLMCGSGASALW